MASRRMPLRAERLMGLTLRTPSTGFGQCRFQHRAGLQRLIVAQRGKHRQREDLLRRGFTVWQCAIGIAEVRESRHDVNWPRIADVERDVALLEVLQDEVATR